MNACFAMSCLQKLCCHIGPSELKAVALQLKLCSMKWFPAHSSAATDRSEDPGLLAPCVCCLDPEVPDSQSISTNEGYLIYSDTPGQD